MDLRAEFEALGGRFAGGPNPTGWAPCYRLGENERHASAGFNVITGHYKAFSGDADNVSESIIDMRARLVGGKISESLAFYAERAALAPDRPAPKKPMARPPVAYPSLDAAIESRRTSIVWKNERRDVQVALRTEYQYEDGSVAFCIVRFEFADGNGKRCKTIRPFSPSQRGWVEASIPAPRPIYRLPLIRAHNGTIFFVEGEKCIDRLESIGLFATGLAHGAKSDAQTDVCPLAGKTVVILPDNDNEGFGFADRIQARLLELSPPAKVKQVRLEGLGHRDDVADWIDERRERGGSVDAIRRELEAVVDATLESRVSTVVEATQGTNRPEIEITERRHEVLEQTLSALNRDTGLYRRGTQLVRVVELESPIYKAAGGGEIRGVQGMPQIIPVGESSLSCRLASVADFYVMHTDRNREQVAWPAHPPIWLTRAILEHGEYPGVRELRGVVEHPFVRANGTLVTAKGYDPETGFYLASDLTIDAIPDRPSKADAESAAAVLLHLIRQFPFASNADRAVALAGLLTIHARPGIEGPVPGVVFNSNRAGTGKGRLIDALGTIATGRCVPTSSYPKTDDEAAKVKTSLAVAGTPIVHLDNIPNGSAYGSASLDSMLTSTVVNDRILGQSKTTGPLPFMMTCFLSGNNTTPSADAHRRWMVSNLMTELENPEERADFDHPDLLAHIRQHRAKYVAEVLVILRAHAVAGFPAGWSGRLGSFEEWDRLVRGAVWYSTGWDCNVTRKQAAAESPDRLAKLALLEAWSELPGGGPEGYGLTCEAVHKFATEAIGGPDDPDIATALARFARDAKLPTVRSLGNLIRAMRGEVVGGMRFEKSGERKRSALWRVAKTDTYNPNFQNRGLLGTIHGESGESGESNSHTPRSGPDSILICSSYPERYDRSENDTHQTHQTHPDDWREEDL